MIIKTELYLKIKMKTFKTQPLKKEKESNCRNSNQLTQLRTFRRVRSYYRGLTSEVKRIRINAQNVSNSKFGSLFFNTATKGEFKK